MGKGSMIVGFISYPQDESGMLENVVIRTIDPSYYNLALQAIAQKELNNYSSELPSFQLHSLSSGLTSQGLPIYRMEYSQQRDQLKIKTMEILVKNSNRIYSIVYDSDASEYPLFVSQVEKMIDSMVLGHQELVDQKVHYYHHEPFVSCNIKIKCLDYVLALEHFYILANEKNAQTR